MKDFFLISSVSVLAIVCSFPLWFTFVSPRKRAPLYPGGVRTLVEVISASKSLSLSRCATSFVSDYACGRKGSSNLGLCGIGIPVCVELEVAHRSEFLLGRSRAEPESPQFRRVWSMDQTICPMPFSRERSVLSVVHHRPLLRAVSTSTCCSGWEMTLSIFLAFHPPENRATCDSTYR